MTTVVASPVAAYVDRLARQQARVDLLLARAVAGPGWRARLPPGDRERLVRSGHFPECSSELE